MIGGCTPATGGYGGHDGPFVSPNGDGNGLYFPEGTRRAAAALRTEGFDDQHHRFARTADLRYFGQAFEVRVSVDDGPITQELVDAVARRFHDEHRALYGYDFAGDDTQQVEWVNLRVSGIGPIRRPEIVEPAPSGRDSRRGSRPVFFDEWQETPVYWRADLGAGDEVAGGIWNDIHAEENAELGLQRGWLSSVFTRRPWRRRGLAAALISRSLALLRERGMSSAALGVDADNPFGALGLYESAGFAVHERFCAWRRSMEDPAT